MFTQTRLQMLPEPLRVLLLGSGGREHALAWKLCQSPLVELIVVCPGNVATEELTKTKNCKYESVEQALSVSKSRNINLAVFTNEADLAAGAVDLFSQEGIPCIGPPKKASLLETSKVFAKRFMSKNNIPTATYGHFSCYEESLLFIEDQLAQGRRKVVLKHTGIGARQGVFVIETLEEAKQTLVAEFGGQPCGTSRQPDFDILIEEFLEDFKTRKENNQGPMTGGMGCVCPTIRCTESMFQALAQGFMARTIAGLGKEGLDFPGFIAIDVILTHDGPIAIEYDLRLGDPETQASMPLIQPDLDLAKVLAQCHSDQISLSSLLFQKDRFAAVVVAVTKKYPLESETQPLHVNLTTPTQKDTIIYHSHTFHPSVQPSQPVVQARGGRVLSVCGIGNNLDVAAQRAYSGMEAVKFEGMEYRTDIDNVL
ncbi:phosphoribosylglycinamide synthetase [Fusarium oxysporum II5]|nr:phosphoribosylglycinamide synthetase [Fusarium oxysporum II5]